MKCLKKFIIVGFLLFVLSGFFGPYSAEAIEYGGLGIYPNKSEVDEKNPLTRSWFIYTLKPGETKEAKVNIVNTSNEQLEVEIYPVDAVTTKDGAFAPEPEDREKTDVGAWVTLTESEVSLGSREAKTIDFTIKVPIDVEVGDHMGAIIAQAKSPSGEAGGGGMLITTRVGARMYITVPGEMVKELAFKEFTYKAEEDTVTFYAALANEGNTRIRTKGKIEIIDSSGNVVNTLSIPEREVFPQKIITIPVEWLEVSLRGKFTAQASLTYDGNRVLVKKLSFLLSGPGQLSFGVKLGLGLLFFVVTAGIGIFVLVKKRKRKK